jgi:hypothetical protein
MHSGFWTDETPHGWKQNWLSWHQGLCNWIAFHGIEGLQDMLRLGNMRRQLSISKICNKKASLLTHSPLFQCSMRVLVYEHLKRTGGLMNR